MASTGDLLKWTGDFIAAFNGRDAAALGARIAENAVWHRGDGSSLEGRGALMARLEGFLSALPDARLMPRQLIPFEDDRLLLEWRLEGTHLGPLELGGGAVAAASGRPVSLVGADFLTFDAAGEIVRDDARVALGNLLAQIAPANEAPDLAAMKAFAESYTAAWCRRDPVAVAAHHDEDSGGICINGAAPFIGREGIVTMAEGFIAAVPDLMLTMESFALRAERGWYNWRLTGTASGPGGTGNRIDIHGFEIWRFTPEGLIDFSNGYFDNAAYARQIEVGA